MAVIKYLIIILLFFVSCKPCDQDFVYQDTRTITYVNKLIRWQYSHDEYIFVCNKCGAEYCEYGNYKKERWYKN